MLLAKKEKIIVFKQKYDRLQHGLKSKECSLLLSQKIKRYGEFYEKASKKFDFKEIYKRAKEIEKTKEGLDNFEIEDFLGSVPHFLGTICDNDLHKIDPKFQGFVIVNLDHAQGPGTHWISLGIFEDTVEFFDPLGCDFLNWPNLPIGLLTFLFETSFKKTIVRIQRLQSSKSSVCGLYCMFYIINRSGYSLQTILNYFDGSRKENDRKLVKYFH